MSNTEINLKDQIATLKEAKSILQNLKKACQKAKEDGKAELIIYGESYMLRKIHKI